MDGEVISGISHTGEWGRATGVRTLSPHVCLGSNGTGFLKLSRELLEAAPQRTWAYRLLEMYQTTAGSTPGIRRSVEVCFGPCICLNLAVWLGGSPPMQASTVSQARPRPHVTNYLSFVVANYPYVCRTAPSGR